MTEADGSTETYGYDALYRLTSESRTGTGAGSNTYGYDPAGNLTSIGGTPLAYDAANKITTYDTHNTNFFTYDTDGNQVRDVLNGTSYGWDDRGNLTSRSIGSNGVVYAYGYNASGQRVHTVFTVSGQPVSSNTFYIYDGDKVLGEVSSAGVVMAAYTWGADGLVSERLPTASPAKSLWYQYGPQGETRALTNSIGQVADSYSYTAYGKSVSASTNDVNPFQYGGKYGYYSEYNGAVLCGHRWYDALITFRWLSRDPIGYKGGDNLYKYCNDAPTNGVDPSGLGVFDLKGKGNQNGKYRSKIGDEDDQKGWPHYDLPGTRSWIDLSGKIYIGKQQVGQVDDKQLPDFDDMVTGDIDSNPDAVRLPPQIQNSIGDDVGVRDDGFWLPWIFPTPAVKGLGLLGDAVEALSKAVGPLAKACKAAMPVLTHH